MNDPHGDQPIRTAGPPLVDASAAVILIHGRGARAEGMLDLVNQFGTIDISYLAPQAANHAWYPNSFMAPVETNEPGRTSGLKLIEELVEQVMSADIPTDSIAISGFSQGGCLASEYVARHPRRYGGLVVFSGGLIGESIDPAEYTGDLQQMPVFIGCSDRDPHIPLERVVETSEVFEQLNGDVNQRIYPQMGHTINREELGHLQSMIDALVH